MNLTPEETQIGKDNYYGALEHTRRDFLKGVIAAGAVSGAGLGAMYFGYGKVADPVRVGIIGTGDEGNVLIGAINPDYIQVKAICDIRPYNRHRAFHGDWGSSSALEARPGLMSVYGWNSEDEAKKHVKVYDRDYTEMLADPEIEAVIIALPLHLHAKAAVDAMLAGKHVLTEKLMAHNIAQCKVMSRVAKEQELLLATGHQRHYSVLYDNAVNLIRWGMLGEIHHIRAQWHRGNLPGNDSWQQPIPGGEKVDPELVREEYLNKNNLYDPIFKKINDFKEALTKSRNPQEVEELEHRLAQWEAWNQDKTINAKDWGYEDMKLDSGRIRTAMEELCRWRLWDRTGGGLMAELGSHQLDAASIFVSAMRADGQKAQPLSVHAVGGRHTFPYDRQADDHVYCQYEFPGPGYEPSFDVGYRDPRTGYPTNKGVPSYEENPSKKIVVTYSSIMGNGFGGYGEIVMGTKGTLVLAREKDVMLYKDSATSTNVKVSGKSGSTTMDSYETGGAAGPVAQAAETGPVSRGYTEEMEHWAWCIRNPDPENQPKCHPKVAAADAVIALTSKVAIDSSKQEGKGGYIEFQKEWFDLDHDATPDGSVVADERASLTKKV